MSENLIMTVEELRSRRGGKWWAAQPDLLPAWVADMDFRTPKAVRQAVAVLAEESDFGYAYREGMPPGLAAGHVFANRMKEKFDWEVDPQLTIACTDLVQGLFLVVEGFSEPGDNVVVQGPTYDPFREAIQDTARVMVVNHMKRNGDKWELDLEALNEDAKTSPLMLLCHPQNPTGRQFTRIELEAIADIAIKNDMVVVSDEIWADFELDEQQHIPFASLSDEIADRTVTMYSAGKSFTIAGLRFAILHFGSQGIKDRFTNRISLRGLGGHNLVGVDTTIAAWRHGSEWFEQVLEILRENRKTVSDFVVQHADVLVASKPESTYLYWINCTGLELEGQSPAEFFRAGGVMLSAGTEFGPEYKDYIRLNFATSPEILEQILARMTEAIESHQRD